MAVVIPLSPYLMGRFGSRKLFLTSMALFAIGSIAASLAPVFAIIMVGRIFQAVAAGLVMPMSFTIVLLEFPRERRGSAMGIVMLVVGFAPAIGPTLSGVLVDTVGWRMLFVIVGVLAFLVLVVAIKALGKGVTFEPTTFDKVSVALSSIGLVALLYGLSSFTKSDNLVAVLVLIVGGVILLGIFAVRQLRLKIPLLKISVLKVGQYRASVLVVMINSATTTGMSVMLPLFIQNLLGYSAFVTGLTMLPGAVAGAIVGLFAGKLFDRKGIRICAVPGAFCMAIALVIMALVFNGQTSIVVAGVAYAFLFIGMQLLNTTVGTWGLNYLDNGVIQHAQATSNTLNQVAGSLVTALVVSMTAVGASFAPAGNTLAGYEIGYHLGFVTLCVVVLINFVIIMLFIRDRKQKAHQTEQAAETSQGIGVVAETERVAAAMNDNPYFVTKGCSLREVAEVLADRKTSGLPVVDDGNKVVGFVSDGDLMKYLANEDGSLFDASLTLFRYTDQEDFSQRVKDLLNMKVDQVMTDKAITVSQTCSLGEACALLSGKRIKKVPVVDGEGVLVGTLSRSDIVRSSLVGLVKQSAV